MSETNNDEDKISTGMTRGRFIGTTAAAAAAFTIVPRNVLGGPGYQAPSDMVNVAGIGVGSQGGGDIRNIADPDVPITTRGGARATGGGMPSGGFPGGGFPGGGAPGGAAPGGQAPSGAAPGGGMAAPPQQEEEEPRRLANIYALCDVDEEYAAHMFGGYPRAKKYTDFRRMLDREPEIDAVVVGTPDHNHAPIAAYAMKMGKHVYVEKPMAKTVFETRELRRIAKEMNVVTQQGNQGHNSEGSFLTVELIRAGALGDIREVHFNTDRPSGWWPQGNLTRPEGVRVPRTLDWDLWLGPAPVKPYNPDICHFVWRGLWDYGTGAIGDMACHIVDVAVWGLDLPTPTTIQATSSAFSDDYMPLVERIVWEFPARGNMPPVTATWVDGGLKQIRPHQLPNGTRMGSELFIGSNDIVMMGSHSGSGPVLYPEEAMEGFTPPEPSIPRPGDIFEDWINAIKNGTKSTNDFEHSAHLAEIVLLGLVAVAAQGNNTILEYDGEKMEFTNLPEANDLLHYEYRQGWTL